MSENEDVLAGHEVERRQATVEVETAGGAGQDENGVRVLVLETNEGREQLADPLRRERCFPQSRHARSLSL